MEKIVPEVDAGLVELCAAAAPTWRPPWLVLFRRLWPWEIWDPMVRVIEPFIRPIFSFFLASRSRTSARSTGERRSQRAARPFGQWYGCRSSAMMLVGWRVEGSLGTWPSPALRALAEFDSAPTGSAPPPAGPPPQARPQPTRGKPSSRGSGVSLAIDDVVDAVRVDLRPVVVGYVLGAVLVPVRHDVTIAD